MRVITGAGPSAALAVGGGDGQGGPPGEAGGGGGVQGDLWHLQGAGGAQDAGVGRGPD